MYEVEIQFENGYVLKADAAEFTVVTNEFHNTITALKWVDITPEPLYIDVTKIVSVIVKPEDPKRKRQRRRTEAEVEG